jgi:hypothetical protein
LAEEVGVAVVAGVLAEDVDEHPPEGHALGVGVVEGWGGGHGLAAAVAFGLPGVERLVDSLVGERVGEVEVAVGVLVAVVVGEVGDPGPGGEVVALDLGEVANQAEQGADNRPTRFGPRSRR